MVKFSRGTVGTRSARCERPDLWGPGEGDLPRLPDFRTTSFLPEHKIAFEQKERREGGNFLNPVVEAINQSASTPLLATCVGNGVT